MFERYTEQARRSIFFARYEASQFGARSIEPEHLLLGLLREDRSLRSILPSAKRDEIRKRIEEKAPQPIERISTSVDMPLSQDCKRALTYAAEEGEALQHRVIDSWHLALGLLRLEDSLAALLLRGSGIDYAALHATPPESLSPRQPPAAETAAGPLLQPVASLLDLLKVSAQLADARGAARLKRAPWTRKEALGHLIDWASAHQQWIAQALTAPELNVAGYPQDSWLAAQNYADVPWEEARTLLVSLNRLLVHVIGGIPQNKTDTPCRIGAAEPISLRELIERYVSHCEDIVGQLLMRG
ncbi:MAG: Clp protease N-terminal domain-containing protein [Bryobacteraceae bacterium]|jgi:ATP-dependent Clp protease ATP-binding subunit ClpA